MDSRADPVTSPDVRGIRADRPGLLVLKRPDDREPAGQSGRVDRRGDADQDAENDGQADRHPRWLEDEPESRAGPGRPAGPRRPRRRRLRRSLRRCPAGRPRRRPCPRPGRLVIPVARSTPISRTRSRTLIEYVFTMPRPATRTAMRASASSRRKIRSRASPTVPCDAARGRRARARTALPWRRARRATTTPARARTELRRSPPR